MAKWFDGEIRASKTTWEIVVVGIRGEKIETERERRVQIGFSGRTGGVSCLGLFTLGKTEKQETEGY